MYKTAFEIAYKLGKSGLEYFNDLSPQTAIWEEHCWLCFLLTKTIPIVFYYLICSHDSKSKYYTEVPIVLLWMHVSYSFLCHSPKGTTFSRCFYQCVPVCKYNKTQSYIPFLSHFYTKSVILIQYFVPFFFHLTYSGEFFMSVHVNLHTHNCIIFHCTDARIPSSGSVHFAESMLWALIFLWSWPVPYRRLFRTLWFDGQWLETRANPCN